MHRQALRAATQIVSAVWHCAAARRVPPRASATSSHFPAAASAWSDAALAFSAAAWAPRAASAAFGALGWLAAAFLA
tara:strand:- start:291 stop:521 length:231 start_codon:yes stop_codon:yes gene_type:complete